MSKAYVQRTVKFINKVGTFTAYLQCAQGELWQTYTKDGSTFSNIVPDFTVTLPVVDFVVISSRTAGITGLNGTPTWYLGTTQINSGNTVIYRPDVFELVPVGGGRSYYGLRIKKNLVELTGGSSITLKAVGDLLISATGTTDSIQAEATVSIMPASSNGIKCIVRDVTPAVVSGTRAAFTFEAEEQQMNLTVDVYKGASQLTSGLTYQWQRVTNGVWANLTDNSRSGGDIISGAGTATLIIGENEVMTYTQLRCAVSQNGTVIGYGIANVMDATDPYVINPNPYPIDETIENSGDTVAYNPSIVSRDSGTAQADLTAEGFYFTYTTSAGVDVTPVALKNKKATGTGPDESGNQAHFINNDGSQGAVCNYPVNYSMCNSNGDIGVSIETVADLKDY